jgi:D-glycero-D-manno-heptose 1,7-bisphosphate phosphatase
MNKAIFIDKDGTLIHNVPYNVNPKLIRLLDKTVEGLRLLQEAGYQLVVVSNQSGVARGMFKEQELNRVESKLRHLLASSGVRLSGFYYCPHHPDGIVARYAIDCFCRKPKPGMLFQASNDLNINLMDCWLIGDILNDVEAGNRVGCGTVLLDNGSETEWDLSPIRRPDFVATDLLEAAQIILMAEKLPVLEYQPNGNGHYER